MTYLELSEHGGGAPAFGIFVDGDGVLGVSDRAGRITTLDYEDEFPWARTGAGDVPQALDVKAASGSGSAWSAPATSRGTYSSRRTSAKRAPATWSTACARPAAAASAARTARSGDCSDPTPPKGRDSD